MEQAVCAYWVKLENGGVIATRLRPADIVHFTVDWNEYFPGFYADTQGSYVGSYIKEVVRFTDDKLYDMLPDLAKMSRHDFVEAVTVAGMESEQTGSFELINDDVVYVPLGDN